MSFLRPRIIGDPAPPQWSSVKTDEIHYRRMRWVEVLREDPDHELWLYRNLEDMPVRFHWMVHGRPSALSLAAADPILRRAGLKNSRFAAAARFFDLSFDQAHHILCYCGYGEEPVVPARRIAARIVETLGDRSWVAPGDHDRHVD